MALPEAHRSRYATALALAALLGTHSPPAGASEIDAAAIRLDYSYADTWTLEAESFQLANGVAETLAAAPGDATVVLLAFPVAPGQRADLKLERFEVYAEGAESWISNESGVHGTERSPRIHYLGHGKLDPSIRIGLSIDPDGRNLSGIVAHPDGAYDLSQLDMEGASAHLPVYEIGTGTAKRRGLEVSTSCHTAEEPQFFDPSAIATALQEAGSVTRHDATLHQAVIAFDTDGEFVKDYETYPNDPGAAAAAETAITNWVTAVNVMYERDLGLRLVKGDTMLRTDAATDPYISSDTLAQLEEVGEEWELNKVGVPRVFVALLSGKGFSSGGGCSAAGIAWVDSYCDPVVDHDIWDGGSYSATQVLRCVPLNGSGNVVLLGHEVGHNAGSGHTHCYSPPVDHCYNAAAGCWGGAPSCPDFSGAIPGMPAGRGTVMSYCHFGAPSGANCGSSQQYFHPTVSANIKMSITANTYAGCVSHVTGGCSVPDSELTYAYVTHAATHTLQACAKITFGTSYTATGTVNATTPELVFSGTVTIGGTFSAYNAMP